MTSTGEQQTQERAQAYPQPTTVGRTTRGGVSDCLQLLKKPFKNNEKPKK